VTAYFSNKKASLKNADQELALLQWVLLLQQIISNQFESLIFLNG